MLQFKDNAADLKTGIITMTNGSDHEKTVEIYVPNRYDAFTKIPAGGKLTVTTMSSGESFMYLAQADDELEVTLSTGVAKVEVNG